MIEKTKRMMIVSFIILVSLCTCMIFAQSFFISKKNEETIGEMGELYMAETNRQLLQKFASITSIWTREAKGISVRNPVEKAVYGEELKENLTIGARVRNFASMELCTDSGEREIIYGQPVKGEESPEIQKGLEDRGSWLSSGTDAKGNEMILLSLKTAYPMADGKTASFMSLGFPVGILEEALVLDDEESMAYSMIIRKDGKFVVRGKDVTEETYFKWILENTEGVDGEKPEDFVKELKETMKSEGDYEGQVKTEKGLRHLHCLPLEGSDWYLVSVMSYEVLENTINSLEETRQSSLLGMVTFILATMLVVFVMYYRMTRKYMERLESSMRETEKANQAKREFLSNMSHDLRTPMNGIVGMTAIAAANIHDEEKVQDCLKKISLSGKHLLGILNDVLDMSKVESGKLTLNVEMISLYDIMDSLASIMQEQIKSKNQHFDIFNQNMEEEMVWCDDVRLSQVLLNLLSNAVKYTPEGGTINVYLFQESSPKGEEYVRCHFHVKDNGIGMSEDFQKNIFETFTREDRARKVEGTGLGMAIAAHLVELMGGTIEVESKQGEGSEFRVILDLKRANEKSGDMVLPQWKVLVVDNNQNLCESAAVELRGIGIRPDWVTGGKEAIQKVKESLLTGNKYSLVLLDWKMPEMDGLETARELRALAGDELPILIISAYDWSDIEAEAREVGVTGFVSKPLFKSNLYMELSRLAGKAPVVEREEEICFENKRILLAEDNELNREIAQEILSDVGFEVEWAENGKVCMDMFAASPEGYYDAVLMDIRMPVMDGYEACRNIRAMEREDADLPIIAMTADAFSEDRQRSLRSGMNEHVPKPIDVDKLYQILNQYIRKTKE